MELAPSKFTIVTLIILMGGSVFIHGFMSRILGLTMVCIVDPEMNKKNATNKTEVDNPCHYNESDSNNDTKHTHLGYSGTFKWTPIEQSNVVAFHNWARFVWLPFSGFVIRLFNATQVFGAATLVCIIVTALFPVAAIHGGWQGAVGIRFVLGSAHAFSSPCLDQIVAKYIPKEVKSTAYAFITAGSQVAVFVGSPLGAYFCLGSLWGGWPAIFYVAALIAFGWLMIWELYTIYLFYWPKYKGFSTRRSGSYAVGGSDRQENLAQHNESTEHLQTGTRSYKEMFIDFYHNILTERAVYGLFPCDVAATWTITLYIYYLPQFYRDVLKVSLQNNGYFSALPFVVQMVFNTIGMVGSGLCILLTVLVCIPPKGTIALVCIGYGLYSCTTPGFRTSLISINRDWAAVISACCTIFAMIGGIVFPYIVGAIIKVGTVHEYRTLFSIMFALDIFAALAYIFLGSLEGKAERRAMSNPVDDKRN